MSRKVGGNPVQMILALQKAMENLTPLTKTQLIEQLFGKYQQARVQALIENIGKVGSQTTTVMELMGATQSELAQVSDRELKTLTESASGKFKRMV
ncbi:MAG: hypothetical protein ACKO96_04140, partial [Flammeovirgaceae bacterium]